MFVKCERGSTKAELHFSFQATNVEEVTAPILEMLIETNDNLAVVFFEHDDQQDFAFLNGMEKIDDECDNVSIPLVKINDQSKAGFPVVMVLTGQPVPKL